MIHASPIHHRIARGVMANGVVALAREIPDPDIVAVAVGIRAGARFETDATAGVSKFVEKLLLQGTERRPGPDLVQRPIVVRGGAYGTQLGSEILIVSGQVRSTDVDVLMDVITDVILHSEFRADRKENEARVILEELNARRASPNTLANDLFLPAVFGTHPLARSTAGNLENTPKLSLETILAFRDQYLVGANTVVAVAGNISSAEAFSRIEDGFGNMPRGTAAAPSNVPPPAARAQRIDHIAGSAQARVMIGGPLPGLDNADRFPLTVANSMLGGSAFRLFKEIRDIRGLSYDPAPGQSVYPDAGLWMAAAGTDPANIETVLDLLKAEHVRLGHEPLTDRELADAKDYLEGSLVVSLETPSAQSGQMIRDEIFGAPVLAPEHLESIRRVTAEDVLRVSRQHLDPDRATVVVVKPQ
ncbi:MAG: pitrilysin family protein [Chloroflexota bacterium]